MSINLHGWSLIRKKSNKDIDSHSKHIHNIFPQYDTNELIEKILPLIENQQLLG